MKKSLFLILLGALLLPVFSCLPAGKASAQLVWGFDNAGLSIYSITGSIMGVLWIIFALFVVVCFVVAGIMFLTAMGDPAKLKIARSAFIWGVAGVVVGILAYSILWIIGGALTY